MPKPSSSLIEYIYRVAGAYRDDVSSETELLSRYAQAQDEQAFRVLMARHGPMVWSICRGILNRTEDVEEAYQTTFLALARRAQKVRVNVVGWLHQVAHRTALNARRNAKSRQKLHQGLQASVLRAAGAADSAQPEVYEELHGAIAKMPEALRVPLVLHYLEGKTQAEVAGILGVDESAVWHRLRRGKATLEKRLRSQGLALSAGTLGALFAATASKGALPPGLIGKTVEAAMAFRNGKLTGGLAKLAQEVLKHTPGSTP